MSEPIFKKPTNAARITIKGYTFIAVISVPKKNNSDDAYKEALIILKEKRKSYKYNDCILVDTPNYWVIYSSIIDVTKPRITIEELARLNGQRGATYRPVKQLKSPIKKHKPGPVPIKDSVVVKPSTNVEYGYVMIDGQKVLLEKPWPKQHVPFLKALTKCSFHYHNIVSSVNSLNRNAKRFKEQDEFHGGIHYEYIMPFIDTIGEIGSACDTYRNSKYPCSPEAAKKAIVELGKVYPYLFDYLRTVDEVGDERGYGNYDEATLQMGRLKLRKPANQRRAGWSYDAGGGYIYRPSDNYKYY